MASPPASVASAEDHPIEDTTTPAPVASAEDHPIEDTTTPAPVASTEDKPIEEMPDVEVPEPTPIMLAPKIGNSSDRDRTLLNKEDNGSDVGPETAQLGTNDKSSSNLEELEEGNRLDDRNDGSLPGKEQRAKRILMGSILSLIVCIAAGLIAVFSVRARSASRLVVEPTQSPSISLSPTITPIPTDVPSVEPTRYPTMSPSSQPTREPSLSPTDHPSASPTNYPTISSAPSSAPSAAPSRDYFTLLQDFFFGQYAVDFGSGGDATPPVLAVEWLAIESAKKRNVELNNNLVQRFALLTMAFEMHNASSVFDASSNAQVGVDACSWKGIRCDDQGNVVEVNWDFQNASGKIAPEVRLLGSTLTRLDLSNNQLVGSIPEGLYSLTNLKRLYLFKNRLSGTISAKISDLDSITHFHLSHNSFSGTIPPELKSDTSGIRPLEYFNLYSNKLTGPLPENLRLRDMIYFDVGRNDLTGTLPTDIGEKFVAARHLHFDHNNFRGTLPASFNTVGNGRLESFSIDHNQLTGTLPGERTLYNKLVQYTFHSNQFSAIGADVCRMEVPFGEMVELRGDCDVCRCDGFFDLCELQCFRG